MENRKGSEIFLGVIGVATLIVAIIGATFAFFSANAGSEEGAIQAGSTLLKLGFKDDEGAGLKFNLIPAADNIARYAATNETHISTKGRCVDDNNNEICSSYDFTIGNPNFNTNQPMYASIKISSLDFTNLYFEILDEEGNVIVQPTNFADPTRNKDNVIALPELDQLLIASTEDSENSAFNEEDPDTYTEICESSTWNGKTQEWCNVKKYTMIVWIHETGSDQSEADSLKVFAAGINFTSASGSTGVTGVIAAADGQGGGASTTE